MIYIINVFNRTSLLVSQATRYVCLVLCYKYVCVWADRSADTKHLHNRISFSVLYFAVLFFRVHPPAHISSESLAAA